ncbi:Gfo/Idh/MocA family protein [Cognatishimia activa]|uniref:Gfo/Idh/MocA family oxidoreductase n=1 Tax=Cognatishimia activa TaxID=1715691 RepID=A0A975ERD2_9RHOB|nr:Gfo/Idh/MocA family oxidoreductase [Cognatishimia activa]QTN36770.1 Gfo/Idh/MocA family oxidoreductase [Cognatishimia activa]
MTRLKLGMVGGGQGAFIGAVHRMAARLDDQWELVAGALSSDPERALTSSRELGISDDRSYSNFAAMAQAEADRADGIDAVAIVTPNHAHAGPAISFLNYGIHVICDKPLSATLDQARDIAHAVKESGKCFVLTHNYTGYPLVRQARQMIAGGELGDIRVVQVEYAQDWLAEEVSNKQADWRTDPAKSGAGGCIGDIGTHAINLATFVTGLEVKEVAADLDTFVPGRGLDDNAQVFLRFGGGAKGMLWSSQVAVGNENNLTLRIYGSKAGIEWSQENPNVLLFTRFGEPKQVLTRGGPGTSPADTRIPSGHPEGYLEAFGTIYADAAKLIRAHDRKSDAPQSDPLPNINDGVFGMAFVSACVKSSENNSAWVKVNS